MPAVVQACVSRPPGARSAPEMASGRRDHLFPSTHGCNETKEEVLWVKQFSYKLYHKSTFKLPNGRQSTKADAWQQAHSAAQAGTHPSCPNLGPFFSPSFLRLRKKLA